MRKFVYRIFRIPMTNTNVIFLNGTNYALYGSDKKDEDAIICNVLNDVYNRRLKCSYEGTYDKYSIIRIEDYFHFDSYLKAQLHNFDFEIYHTLERYIEKYKKEITNFQYIKFFTVEQHCYYPDCEIFPHQFSYIPYQTEGAKLKRFKQVANALVGCYWRFWCNEM